jgi:hypothetical protein
LIIIMPSFVGRTFRWAALVTACALAGPFVAQAQAQVAGRQGPPPPRGRLGPGRQGPPAAAPGISPAELQELMDAMVVVQAERDLQLADDQFAAFLTRLKTLQAARRRSDNQRNRALMELRRFVQSEASAAAAADEGVRARLKALDDAETQGMADVRQARTGVDQILTPRQQARFRLLEEQIERRKLELFARSRRSLPPQ